MNIYVGLFIVLYLLTGGSGVAVQAMGVFIGTARSGVMTPRRERGLGSGLVERDELRKLVLSSWLLATYPLLGCLCFLGRLTAPRQRCVYK